MARIPVPRFNVGSIQPATIREDPQAATAPADLVGEFGRQVAALGDGLENDRLDRERRTAQVQITQDLNNLRLKVGALNDPDEIDRVWAEETKGMRAALPAIYSERNHADIGLMFDDLAGRHAYALGAQAIDRRNEARRDTAILHRTTIATAAPSLDERTRKDQMDGYFAHVDELVRAGVMTPEKAELEKQEFQAEIDDLAATKMVAEDPELFLDQYRNNGMYANLDPKRAMTLEATAKNALAQAQKQRDKAIGDDLDEVIAAAQVGRNHAFEGRMSDPDVMVNPKYRAARAAVQLRNDLPGFAAMSIPQMEAMVAAEKAKTVTDRFQLNRLPAMQKILSAAKTTAANAAAAQAKAIEEQLEQIIDAANKDRVHHSEHVLLSPLVQAHPKYQEALAAVQLRADRPVFATLPIAQLENAIALENGRPVGPQFEMDRLDAMEDALDAARKAWENPIEHSAAIGLGTPPPISAPGSVAGRAAAQEFRNRAAYANSLVGGGYVKDAKFFTQDERDTLRAAVGVESDPAARVQLAEAMAAGFGADTDRAITEVAGDQTFAHVASLMAAGGNRQIAEDAFRGQQAIAGKTVQMPTRAVRTAVSQEVLGGVLAADPDTEANVRLVADAIYASSANLIDPEDDEAQRSAYAVALQRAMGQTKGPRGGFGGVAEVNGSKVILPVDVSEEQVVAAFEQAAFDLDDTRLEDDREAAEAYLDANREGFFIDVGKGARPAAKPRSDEPWKKWRQANRRSGNGRPTFGGRLLTASQMRNAKLVPVGDDVFAMQIEARGRFYDVMDENGGKYIFSMRKLIKAARP